MSETSAVGLVGAVLLACATSSGEPDAPAPAERPPTLAAPERAVPPAALATGNAVDAEPPPAPPMMLREVVAIDPAATSGLVEFARMRAQGSVYVGPLAGNGGRDVLVHVPSGVEDDARFELIYHFHGTYSEHIEQARPGLAKKMWVGWDRLEQTVDAATELQRARPYAVVLVYPLSAGKRAEPEVKGWFNKAYDRMWMHPTDDPRYTDSFEQLHREVTAVLADAFGIPGDRLASRVVVEGHSAGGMALYNIARTGSPLVRDYVFLDASFQDWGDGTYAATRETSEPARVTLIMTDRGIADPYGKRDPWCERLASEAELFARHAESCRGRPDHKPRGTRASCATLETSAGSWPSYERWCAGMKTDLQGWPGAVVVRTRVPHGNQPRHFTGGLELPPGWDVAGYGRDPSTR